MGMFGYVDEKTTTIAEIGFIAVDPILRADCESLVLREYGPDLEPEEEARFENWEKF